MLLSPRTHLTLPEVLLSPAGRDTLGGVSRRPASSLLSLFHSLLHKVEGQIFHYKLNNIF